MATAQAKPEPKGDGIFCKEGVVAAAILNPVREELTGSTLEAYKISGHADLIASSPLFAGLSEHHCEEVARRAQPKKFTRGEILFTQGQPVHDLLLIRSGCVKITQLSSDGKEVILWIYGPRNVVGVFPEPLSSSQSCSARAMAQSTALTWEYGDLEGLMQEYPRIRKNIGLILTARLDELEERFRELATEKVAKRLSLALLRLLKQIGKKMDRGVQVDLSREELAQMTGTTLFTISRILSRWSELGIVLPRREAVLVYDEHLLELAGNENL
jgi:CRP-like cAMP-binding protein